MCPVKITALRNSYGTPTNLYVNRKTISFQGGTMQSIPLKMSCMGYHSCLMNLLEKSNVTQKWCVDDGNELSRNSQFPAELTPDVENLRTRVRVKSHLVRPDGQCFCRRKHGRCSHTRILKKLKDTMISDPFLGCRTCRKLSGYI